MGQSRKTTTNRKPKYRTATHVPNPFQTNMLVAAGDRRVLTSDLGNIKDKRLVTKVTCSRSPDDAILR